jgi:hypothetical protein
VRDVRREVVGGVRLGSGPHLVERQTSGSRGRRGVAGSWHADHDPGAAQCGSSALPGAARTRRPWRARVVTGYLRGQVGSRPDAGARGQARPRAAASSQSSSRTSGCAASRMR